VYGGKPCILHLGSLNIKISKKKVRKRREKRTCERGIGSDAVKLVNPI